MKMHTSFVILLVCMLNVIVYGSMWKDDFTADITANPNIDQAYVVEMKWDSSSSYLPAQDPALVDPVLQDVTGMWPMDTMDSILGTPDVSPTKVNGTIFGNVTLIPGKIGSALKVIGGTGSYIQMDPSPVSLQQVTTTGFSVALWFMPIENAGDYYMMEKIYDSVDLQVRSGKYYACSVRNNNNQFFTVYSAANTVSYNSWDHIVCTFDPVTMNLTLYLNGSYVGATYADLTPGIYFGVSKMGFGARPLGTTVTSVTCAFDEITFYKKVLTAANVLSLFQRTTTVVPYPGPSFRSTLIQYTPVLQPKSFSFWDFVPSWTTSSGSADDLLLEISTNRGKDWCPVQNNVAFGDTQLCRLPAANIIYRVTIKKNLALQYVQFTYIDESPVRNWTSPIGINREGISYYYNSQMMLDAQKSAAVIYTTNSLDSNYYPTDINATGTADALLRFEKEFNYTILATGTGVIEIGINGAPWRQYINVPADIPAALNPQGGWYIKLDSSFGANHITEINVVPNQYVSTFRTEPFNPSYIANFQNFSAARFMDAQATNGQNIAHWEDRTKTTYWSQAFTKISTPVQITSVVYDPTTVNAYAGKYKALVTTSSPHNLVTGQSVSISGTDAMVTAWTFDGVGQGSFSLNFAATVAVVDSTHFYFIFGQYEWMLAVYYWDRTTVTFQAGTTGTVTVQVSPGIALEYLVALAEQQNSNPWFCVPHLATDDYVTQMATLLYQTVKPQYNIYIEYSNEIWNTGFIQTSHISSMAALLNITSEQYIATRVAQIWKIFNDVFGSQSSRVIKLVPGFAAGSDWNQQILAALNTTTFNPHNIKADVLSIAPYFGGSIGSIIGAAGTMNTISFDEILDMTRDSIYDDTESMTIANVAVAKEFGVKLVAYEGGQSLVAGIEYTGSPWTNLTDKLTGTNRQGRMGDIYRQMHWIWSKNGGDLFNTFTDVGDYSQWGSWGLIEDPTFPRDTQYKYLVTRDIQDSYLSLQAGIALPTNAPTVSPTMSPTNPPSVSPTIAPTNGPTHPTGSTATGTQTSTTSHATTAAVPTATVSTTGGSGGNNEQSAASNQLAVNCILCVAIASILVGL